MQEIQRQQAPRSFQPIEQPHDTPNRDTFEQRHGELHGKDAARHARHDGEERLGHRRVDGDRVVPLVDQPVLGRVAQRLQEGVGRDMQIGVEPGIHDPPVPDIAVDVARQRRRREQEPEAKQDCSADQHRNDAIGSPAGSEPRGDEAESGLRDGAGVEEVVARCPALHGAPGQDRGGGDDQQCGQGRAPFRAQAPPPGPVARHPAPHGWTWPQPPGFRDLRAARRGVRPSARRGSPRRRCHTMDRPS